MPEKLYGMQKHLSFILVLYCLSTHLQGQRTLEIAHLSEPLSIDGEHEPGKWKGIDPEGGFVQMEPDAGAPASAPSEIYVGQDDQSIYISAIFYFEDPPVARIQKRDQLSESDDSFILILDTYNDNRTGYGFWVTPLGTQADFRLTDDGRTVDLNWDAVWESAAKIGETSWVVELAIPFSSLKYDSKTSTWGVNLGRLIRSNFEKSYWSGKLTGDFRISQGGKLTGIDSPDRKAGFTLFPYLTMQYTREQEPVPNSSIRPNAGMDLKWKINPNITAEGTVNPDFATVEADQEQINLTRYELNYPEKRLFFQEGNELYNTRIKPFYSRRIQDILYGAKANGKAGPYQFSMMNVRTLQRSPEDEIPYFLSTARVKRDFLSSSSLGFTAVDKRNDSSFVTTFSGDYMLNLGKNWKLTGQLVASLPGDFNSHSAWFMRFAHESNIHHVHFRYTEVGENFRENVNQTGYVTDDDRREMDADLSYRWWLNNDMFRYIRISSRNNIFWSRVNGNLRSWYITAGARAYLENRLSFDYYYNNEYKLFEKSYYNHQHSIGVGYNTDEWSQASVDVSFGDNFDRDFFRLKANASVKLSENFALGYTFDHVSFDPDTTNSTTYINVIKLSYNFTRDLWVELFGQTRSNSGKFYLYGKFGWRFKPPFGTLFIIYSHDEEYFFDIRNEVNAVFVKFQLPITLGTGK